MDFLELLNKVARVARPAHHEYIPMESMGDKFENSGLDSLDVLMIVMYMAMIYDIDDEASKEIQPETPEELFQAVNKLKRRDPESIKSALEMIQ
jgi:acyl carrier protein